MKVICEVTLLCDATSCYKCNYILD